MLVDNDLVSIQEARSLARNAKKAQQILAKFSEEQIDRIVREMVDTAVSNAEILAKMAVEETGFGKVEDKTFKNLLASKDLYEYIKDMKTVGIISDDPEKMVIEIAEPMGVVMGIIPSTNPTSTAIFKCIISIKSRNGIVVAPHPTAKKCTYSASMLMSEAAVRGGAPDGVIGCVSNITMEATNEIMKSPDISIILATGGSNMVKAAYSAGKPALGVGPGNVPAYIERTADIKKAVANIIESKTFDNGTICASEQAIVVEDCIKDKVIKEFRLQGAYFMNDEETKKVSSVLFNNNYTMNAAFVGKSALYIAEKVGMDIPKGTKVLIGMQEGVGKQWPLSYEKLTTVLGFYSVKDWEEACELCIKLLNNGGIGHSLSIHSEDRDIILKFATKPVFRILVNAPSSQGGVGAATGLAPSFTLGCGTWGGSSTSDNVTPKHLINIKRVAYGRNKVAKSIESGNNVNISDADIKQIIEKIVSNLR